MNVQVVPNRAAVHVVPRGELDLATVPDLEAQLDELQGLGFDRVVLDLRALEFMDSSGLALVMRRRLPVVAGRGQPAAVLKIAGLLDEIVVVSERDAPPLPVAA